jgi:hypothetical protein
VARQANRFAPRDDRSQPATFVRWGWRAKRAQTSAQSLIVTHS